jgi:uncharacterized protein YsxB (DUF464 family)
MIRIQVERDADGRPARVLITGHAGFAPHGKDIVCAAVSAISIGMVNAIEEMFGVQVHGDDDEEGKLDCRLPRDVSPDVAEKIVLLFEAMLLSLKNVADVYPSYVKMKERNR